jgi:hypothetical protein
MIEELIWVDERMVRSCLTPDEFWLLYRLVDD